MGAKVSGMHRVWNLGSVAGLALTSIWVALGVPFIRFLFLDNLLLLGLGEFLPLGFTDGSTIFHHWRHP
jgi:hypothetical protein